MNFYLMARWWTRNIIWRWWKGWNKHWGEKGLICEGKKMVAPSWQCCSRFLPSDSWFSHKTWDYTHPPASILTHQTLHQQTSFYSLSWNPYWMDYNLSLKEIKENSLAGLCSIPKEAFQECFQNWKKCWEWCVKVEGSILKGTKSNSS